MSFSELKKYYLGDVIDLKSGKSRPKEIGTYPVYGGNGILGYTNKFNVSEETIIIGRVGAYCGSVYFEDKNIWISDNALYAKAKKGFNSKFLYYYLKDRNLNTMAGGSSHPLLTQGQLNLLEVELPEEIHQNSISSLLSSLDETIKTNVEINKTLEEMAKAIFKEWFVDFNFPNATGKFQETEIGKIPFGWTVETFENVFDADRGLSYKGAGLAQSDATPMHNLNSVLEGGGYKTIGIKYYNGDYKDKHIVNAGELIIANTEQGHKYMLIGYPAIIPQFYGEHGIFSHHIYRLRPKKNCWLTPDFMYHLLLQPQARDQVIGFANGTTVNMLKIEGLHKPKFAMPHRELAENFTAIAKANRLQAEQNIEENQSLSNLRDTLLPKLMKGEINVNLQ